MVCGITQYRVHVLLLGSISRTGAVEGVDLSYDGAVSLCLVGDTGLVGVVSTHRMGARVAPCDVP